jgi:hypothetical protein
MRGTSVGSDGKEIGVLRRLWRWRQCGYDDSVDEAREWGRCAGPAQARRGQCDNGVTTKVTRERKTARRERPSMFDAGGAKGVRRWHSAKINRKKGTKRAANTILIAPPLESAQTKSRRDCLRPIDEVFTLGLGAAVTMAPVRASGCQRHGVAKIDNYIIWR